MRSALQAEDRAACEVAQHGVTVNNLLPGRFDTDRLRPYIAKIAAHDRIGVDEARLEMAAVKSHEAIGRPGAWRLLRVSRE